jgi:carboxylesterase
MHTIYLHGFGASPAQFDKLREHLPYTGTAPLLPGHGTRPEDLIGVSYKDWLDAARDELFRHDDVLLVGVSNGANIALKLASEWPQNIRGVVSICAPIFLRDRRLALLPYAERFKDRMVKNYTEHPETNYTTYPVCGVLEFMRLGNDVRQSVADITAPTLIISSTLDKVVLEPKSSEYLRKHIPHAQHVPFGLPFHGLLRPPAEYAHVVPVIAYAIDRFAQSLEQRLEEAV